jgi:hypothetical protein
VKFSAARFVEQVFRFGHFNNGRYCQVTKDQGGEKTQNKYFRALQSSNFLQTYKIFLNQKIFTRLLLRFQLFRKGLL